MQKTKRSFNRVLSMMLAVAMVFTLNLTSMTAKAATYSAPTATTEQALPNSVTKITINGTEAAVYQDNNEDASLYIRPVKNTDITVESLQTAAIEFNGTAPITVISGATKVSDTKVTANLINKVAEVKVGNNVYKIAATPANGKSETEADKITVGGEETTIVQRVFSNKYPGNAYYEESKKEWTTINNFLTATLSDASTATKVDIKNGDTLVKTLDLETGTGSVQIGDVTYTVFVTIPGEFHANDLNFWIDFQELQNYESENGALASSDWDTIDSQMEEIIIAQSAWYDTNPTFAEGVSCMDVLQNFLRFATTTINPDTDELYFTLGNTDCMDNCYYVSIIDGLEPFTLADGRDGWMYTNDPNSSIDPEKWYTAPIGAADYTMSSNSKIAWFFAADYTTHPW